MFSFFKKSEPEVVLQELNEEQLSEVAGGHHRHHHHHRHHRHHHHMGNKPMITSLTPGTTMNTSTSTNGVMNSQGTLVPRGTHF